jgi:predicted RNase H-like HicB family nuclease
MEYRGWTITEEWMAVWKMWVATHPDAEGHAFHGRTLAETKEMIDMHIDF